MASKQDAPPYKGEDDASDNIQDEKTQGTWSAIEVAGGPSPEWSKDDETRIRCRMDFRIMPVVFILYLLCFIDRYVSIIVHCVLFIQSTLMRCWCRPPCLKFGKFGGYMADNLHLQNANIGNAKIQGMAKELHLVGDMFNWALTIFYISYVAVEIPSNLVFKVVGGKYYLPGLVASFGLISLCSAFVDSFQGLMACRFFLGFCEGGVTPSIAFYPS